jgi:RNase H-fold protein (predicted Holliday junction resolvase)
MKQRLTDESKNEVAAEEREIKISDEELETLEAKIKVENKFLKMKDIKDDLKDQVKYSVQALEGMLMMEQQKNAELRQDLQISKYRLAVIDKFGDGEL